MSIGAGALALLRCPRCAGSFTDHGGVVRCEGCALEIGPVDGPLDFLPFSSVGDRAEAETDYDWDWRADSRISPLTVARWQLLATRHGAIIAEEASDGVVVSIGGGGENWMASTLDGQVSTYVVVEPSAAQLASARGPGGAGLLRLAAFAEDVPIGDGRANAVELHSVLDHVVAPDRAMAEAARLLVPGGVVTIALGNDGSWYRRIAAKVGLRTHDEHAHAHHFDVATVTALLVRAGLEISRVETLAYLRLPTGLERVLSRPFDEAARRRIVQLTDAALRRVMGRDRGGMLLVAARRPV